MNLENKLPLPLKEQFGKIKAFLKDYTGRAYLVGGGVRDMLLNLPVNDLDIEVYDIDEMTFSKLMQELGAIGVGKSFFVYKIGDIDISLPRTERKNGVGHRAFNVKICSDEKQAARRRDFTMNAMMLDIFNYKLLDFYGGLESLNKKVISLVDENSFAEDSLRVLRGIQFSSRFGFKIDKMTLEVMAKLPLNDLSKSRIFWELEKLFNATFLHFGLYYLIRLGIFEKVFGVKIQKDLFFKTALELYKNKDNFTEELNTYYFMYIVGNLCKLDISKVLENIDAPREYRNIFKNQPFIENDVNDEQLMEIAIDIPIKNWLGNYKKGIIERAKKLDIYEHLYSGGVSVQSVILDGFQKEEIKKELKRRKLEVIKSE
ncbi:MAG: CCA tRNA nucleotidyltransferase [Sulfurospirillaceae bacterium]|nr:CCA tRNA nucleotidyltransferase [Sulfurospirillaceae bacterium]